MLANCESIFKGFHSEEKFCKVIGFGFAGGLILQYSVSDNLYNIGW